jgi:hypothetical protein
VSGTELCSKNETPGADVICNHDFRQFLVKKLAFFSNTNLTIKILHNLSLLSQKSIIFIAIFLEKIFLKPQQSVPGTPCFRDSRQKIVEGEVSQPVCAEGHDDF